MSIGRRLALTAAAVGVIVLCGWCSLLSGIGGWMIGSDIAGREAGVRFRATATAGAVLPPLGMLVTRLERGGPAAQAGIVRGDIVVAADGAPVQDARDLQTSLKRLRPGDRIRLTIDRGDGPRDIEVTLGSFPDAAERPYLGIYFTARAEEPADL
ncbi:MAG: hypothetical protein Fur005_17580 [Roseiflexaceae bacterium]